ncbi:hypothetical protein [Gillisia marina]|uniref:hypothetical protein n=1 Tax=Gillisia marina TaxID=1167637 RepID=UPI00029AC698|nr:hypothetical protein [Gillisia marina]
MSEPLLISLIFCIALIIGVVVGYFLTKLKMNASVEINKANNIQLKNQLDTIKIQHTNILEDIKKANSESKELLEKQINKIEAERDFIRKEKDFLSTELATRNSEFESLAQKKFRTKKGSRRIAGKIQERI